jgi:hypothetical protein
LWTVFWWGDLGQGFGVYFFGGERGDKQRQKQNTGSFAALRMTAQNKSKSEVRLLPHFDSTPGQDDGAKTGNGNGNGNSRSLRG